MYNKLKECWNAQHRSSSDKTFFDFVQNLKKGGEAAKLFINENVDLVESVVGGEQQLTAILSDITNDKNAMENKKYFYEQAMKHLPKVKSLLSLKFEAIRPLCEQLGLDFYQYNEENILPSVRQLTNAIKNETNVVSDPEPIRHMQSIEGKITDLVNAGASKSEIWQAVKGEKWSRKEAWDYVDKITRPDKVQE